MPTRNSRPQNLPDFLRPPLDEVVLGLQFAPPKGYQQIFAGEVWKLFKDHYPEVREQPPLVPTFETFGLPQPPRLSFLSGAQHDRFWFLRPDGDELVQFQQDRLLHNWRKVGDRSNPYPRFERMASGFREEIEQLQAYMAGLVPQELLINQCEVSYINHIAAQETEIPHPSDWLRFVTFTPGDPEDFSVSFREVIADSHGKPEGRLICEATTGLRANGRPVIVLTLTARGAPSGTDINSAFDFIERGRELIVRRFAELTTDKAHVHWGRQQ